eukprot:Nitzschia sp. Nitz4//scaffold54_size114964//21447//22593//NITZ4_003838-RA/size114964-augustus-gene-0.1-mRNA-1//1//CDS//3329554312//2707//frame0
MDYASASPVTIVSEVSDTEDSQFSHDMETERTRHARTSTTKSRRRAPPTHSKHYVQHNYHDHAHDAASDCTDDECAAAIHKGSRPCNRGGVTIPFPEKLHFMLDSMEPQGTTDIVSWQPHGRCFVVHKPKEFVEQIMPRFFRQTKMTSFQRQLNLYGFCRLTAGPDRGGYYHELFLRGRTDLCSGMMRTRVKGNGSKAASSPATEPDFYSMEPCVDTSSSSTCNEDRNQGTEEYMAVDASQPELPVSSTLLESNHVLVSPPRSPMLIQSTDGCSEDSFGLQEENHSGDQVYFEGLPFHYLERKDIMPSLPQFWV